MDKLWVSAGLYIRDGFEASEVLEALMAIVAPSNAEPGCVFFKVLQDKETPRRLTLWECWNDEQALQTHYEQPYTKAFLEKEYTEILYIEKLTQMGTEA